MKSNLAYKCKACNFCVLICILYQYLKNPCQPCTFSIKSKQSVILAIKIGKNWKKHIYFVIESHDGPGLLTWEADFFNLVEGYFQNFLPCPLLVIYVFFFFFFFFLVIQINLKNFDGWSI